MIGIEEAVNFAVDKFKEEYGDDLFLEEGDSFVTIFDNCTLLIEMNEDGNRC